ncbi:MAG: tRNA (5-methylaminomethyl-2-thiouridine)(34)-methyltransferase MnmD [Bacteroidales bacterium]
MNHTITISADGSSTLKLNEFNESYHSVNGAYIEAMHIYINNGLNYLANSNEIYIYDIGFGTGLNCLLSLLWQQNGNNNTVIYYHGIEKYPILMDEIRKLNFPKYITDQLHADCNTTGIQIEQLFIEMHKVPWNEDIKLAPNFILRKSNADITEFNPQPYNAPCIFNNTNSYKTVIFYDTFSPGTQPTLWNCSIFHRFYKNIPVGSILVTYCAKGIVKQALRDAGFIVKRLTGANGKHHMVRAEKI